MKSARNYTIDTQLLIEFERRYPRGQRGKRLEELMRADLKYIEEDISLEEIKIKEEKLRATVKSAELELEIIEKHRIKQEEIENNKLNNIEKAEHNERVFNEELDKRCVYCKGMIEPNQKATTQFTLDDKQFKGHKVCAINNLERIKTVKENYILMLKQIKDKTFVYPEASVENE